MSDEPGSPAPPAGRFARRQRIRKRPEFQQVFERGSRLHSRYFTLLVLPNGGGMSRLGIVASRKVGGAVERNRSKRLIREMFRQQPVERAPGIDAVVIPRREALQAPFPELAQDFRTLWRRGSERIRVTARPSAPR
jgi:ribonuclease P protein component